MRLPRHVVRHGLAALVVVGAGCGTDSGTPSAAEPDADGWVTVADGDTYGAWVLSAQVEGDTWAGCLRLEHVDGTVERCTDPAGAVLFANDIVDVGAAPTGQTLAFVDGGEVATYGEELGLGYEFFVTASGVVDAETGDAVEVVGAEAGLDDVIAAFAGRWDQPGQVSCDDGTPGVDASEISSVEIDGGTVIATSPCSATDGTTSTCRADYVLVGQTVDGDALEATLAPTGTDCGGDDVWLSGLALRVEGDELVVDGVATFVRE